MLFPSDKNSLCFLLQVNYFFLWLFYWLYLVKVACFKSMIFSCSSIFFLKIVYSIISVTVSKSPFIILFSNSYFSLVRNTPRRASLLSVFNTEIEMVTNAFQYRACWLIYVMILSYPFFGWLNSLVTLCFCALGVEWFVVLFMIKASSTYSLFTWFGLMMAAAEFSSSFTTIHRLLMSPTFSFFWSSAPVQGYIL